MYDHECYEESEGENIRIGSKKTRNFEIRVRNRKTDWKKKAG